MITFKMVQCDNLYMVIVTKTYPDGVFEQGFPLYNPGEILANLAGRGIVVPAMYMGRV